MSSRQNDPIPNSFQVPNVYVDQVLPHLSGAEAKILLFIVRKTFGWQKREDRISITQMADGTGVSPRHAMRGVKTLVAMGIVIEHAESGKTTSYRLQLDGSRFNLPGAQNVTPDRMSPVTEGNRTPDKRYRGTPDKREYTETQELNPLRETQTRESAPARVSRTQPYPKPEPKRPEPEPPDDFEPDSESREYALAAGCDPNVEKRKFLNHYAKDRVWFRDPQAAFRSWIDKAPRFRQRPQQGSRASPPVKLSAYAVNSARLDALMAGRDPDEAERQARDEAARRLQEVWQ